ncbi:MAG: hypothetical protein ACRD8O_22475 [Bryobacteraceae bacterium]
MPLPADEKIIALSRDLIQQFDALFGPHANPRGVAIRFHIAEHVHTDIISHSTDGFPTRTGQEFLKFLRAVSSSDPSKPSKSPLEAFLGTHTMALAFVQAPKPAPSSVAVPVAGIDHLPDAVAARRSANFLFDELAERIAMEPIAFRILAQLANDGDTVDDATIHWPEERPLLDHGAMTLAGQLQKSYTKVREAD